MASCGVITSNRKAENGDFIFHPGGIGNRFGLVCGFTFGYLCGIGGGKRKDVSGYCISLRREPKNLTGIKNHQDFITMHDPKTVAFEIKNPFVKRDKGHYRPTLITIWHVDPEKDGTDDSCGWMTRSRHGDKAVFRKIKHDFQFESQYWFIQDGPAAGYPVLSVIGTVVTMYYKALWHVYKHDRKKISRFMNKHIADILHFAEYPHDGLSDSITMKFGYESIGYRVGHLASVIYGDILRKQQKWYQHPRWHIHHWEIQFDFWRDLKRRYWTKCYICEKRGFNLADVHSDRTGYYHGACKHQDRPTASN
jgi:hypothetical protein